MDRKEVLTMKMDAYVDYAVEQLKALTAIPSPSGFAGRRENMFLKS